MKDRIVYTRLSDKKYQELKKLVDEFNEKYPSIYKLRVAKIIRFLIESFMLEVNTVDKLKKFIDEVKI